MNKKYIIVLIKAGRWRLSIAAALASAVGAFIAHPAADLRLSAIFTGSLLFALAVTWLNQIQERKTDRLMARTRSRPLANNTLPLGYAIAWTILCLTSSLLLLFMYGRWTGVTILGVVTLFYNGIYTSMKRHSLFALVLGAVAGAAPPVLGWACAGGGILNIMPLILFLLFFVWQVPHFWLVAERHGPDYEAAKIPLPWHTLGKRFYSQLLLLWVLAFYVVLLALPAFGLVHSAPAQMFVLLISVASMTGLAVRGLTCASIKGKKADDHGFENQLFADFANQPFSQSTIQPASILINLSMAAVCAVLVAEKIFGG